METLTQKAKRDNQLMKLLRVNDIRHIICHTDKGDFCLGLSKGGSAKDYRFILDAVPVSDKENNELLEIFQGILFD